MSKPPIVMRDCQMALVCMQLFRLSLYKGPCSLSGSFQKFHSRWRILFDTELLTMAWLSFSKPAFKPVLILSFRVVRVLVKQHFSMCFRLTFLRPKELLRLKIQLSCN